MPWSTFVKEDTPLTGNEVPRYTVARKPDANRQMKPNSAKFLTCSALLNSDSEVMNANFGKHIIISSLPLIMIHFPSNPSICLLKSLRGSYSQRIPLHCVT